MLQKLFIVISLTASLFGCSQPDTSDTTAISNRPQQYDRFIAIARLSEPALLTSAVRRPDGAISVSDSLRSRINAEQDSFINDIQTRFDGIKVLHQYRFVLNAVVVVAPVALRDEFAQFSQVSYVESPGSFHNLPMEEINDDEDEFPEDISTNNSAIYIGAKEAKDRFGITGRRIRVGIIDTGIDYLHTALGGSGSVSAYRNNDPEIVEANTFPTAKVVGGIDLVGATYNSGSPNFKDHIPNPDNDPLDVQGHGTHVAATVAGIGDGQNTYDGVAPDAELYAIKVFADGGYASTSDHIVIAALEYAIDPDGDLDPSDKLDVINLSLGSSFGTRHILYEEAMTNLVQHGDIVAACSAGNSGDHQFIVGAPGTVEAAISVAASVDGSISNGTLADTLTNFSSRGPRSLDGAFKPDVAAPGYKILSAKVGSGNQGVRFNGTSMAAPHVAGVAALLRQHRPDLNAGDIKAMMTATAKGMRTHERENYRLVQQGAGRVDIVKAAQAATLFSVPNLSFGLQKTDGTVQESRTLTVKNISDDSMSLSFETAGDSALEISTVDSLVVRAGATARLTVRINANSRGLDGLTTLEGKVIAKANGLIVGQLPVMVTVIPTSDITANSRALGGQTVITADNNSRHAGSIEVFRKIALDDIFTPDPNNGARYQRCDLEKAGYRVVTRTVEGEEKTFIQFGVKLSSPLTTWHLCEISIQIDGDNDGRSDQELLGTYLGTLSDRYENAESRFYSLLMDWDQMVANRRRIENSYDLHTRGREDYIGAAMVSYSGFDRYLSSSFSIVEAELPNVQADRNGEFKVKIAALGDTESPIGDDFLGNSWISIDPEAGRVVSGSKTVPANSRESLSVGLSASDVMIFAPTNP